ncbi:MAG: hypothetical protein WCK31_04735 [bacterium]
MKQGSLVITLKYRDGFPDNVKQSPHCRIDWLPVDDESTVYTVRETLPDPEDGEILVRLEEDKMGINVHSGAELALPATFFKEIQPPMELSSLMEEINERELFSV